MRCVKVTWEHDFADDPVLYLSELGGDGYEIRKAQFYWDGRSLKLTHELTRWIAGHCATTGHELYEQTTRTLLRAEPGAWQ